MAFQYAPPRRPSQVDNSVVYRREDEFCSWPFTSGLWQTADGTLIANFATRNVVYDSGDAIRHSVTALLDDPSYRHTTTSIADELRCMPSAAEAMNRVEALIT